MKIKSMGILWIAVLWAASLCMGSGTAVAGEVKRVMVVHSYHETQQGHVVEMTQGIREAFSGFRVNMKFFHMDTKRRTDTAWKIEAGKLAAREMLAFQPHVVIAMDDNAQAFFVKQNMSREKAPFFVFGGVNAEISDYGFPAENVTGVLERPNIKESIELLQKIVPTVKKMVMLSDKSKTTDLFVKYCKTLDLPVEILGYEQPRTLKEWRSVVTKYRDKADAFGLYLLRTIDDDSDPERHVPETELIEFLNAHGKLPTVGFFDTSAKSGLLCGISVSMKEQGYAAARMARAILEGADIADFKIQPTSKGRILLNLKTAERLGIDMDWNIISKADEVVK
ncbi:MAG: hypothetical protein GY737_30655 [Desulfobacteraceae bacterium]|nr:hypothetical protein [Desulfobacteraceae bacterium]